MTDSTMRTPFETSSWLRNGILGLVLLFCQAPTVQAQTDADLVESEETHYYDFWPGKWAEVVGGRADTSATTFTVRRSVHAAAFEEDWRQVYDGGSYRSTALRAWDQVAKRWMFTWVSDNALFQTWRGEKFGDHWYMTKEFEIDGASVLSRQAWIPLGENRLTRTVERSTDGGHSWTTRYHLIFERVSIPPEPRQ